jgi:hypothetical protein
MLMGVDPANRVVYICESDMTTYGILSSSSPMAALWGNIWAWAANTVLTGN